MNGILCHCTSCSEKEDAEDAETCCLKPGGQCFSAIEEEWNPEKKIFEAVRSFGCISENDKALLQCKGDLVPSFYGRSIKCCNFTDLCNKNLLPSYKPRMTSVSSNGFPYENSFFIGVLITAILLGLIILCSSLMYFFHNKNKQRKNSTKPGIQLKNSRNVFPGFISSSGSGVGKPLLLHTSIGRQVIRNYCLGRGRFTEVYLVVWNSTNIVEKLFNTENESRWFRERIVYETASLRHGNILGYISSDVLAYGLRAIYTDYHKLGSLHDYLDKTCLNYTDFFKLIKSAVHGLTYLHIEILGTRKRPAVAHCDITSKNFLINDNKECVISNFESSVTHISTNEKMKMEPDFSLLTPRYMSPEMIKGSINENSFEALKMSDIYSLGLVFYEICQRCATVESNRYAVDVHAVPFYNALPGSPTIEDMQRLYTTKKSKEDLLFIPARWVNDIKVLKPFTQIIRECLYENPKSRPTALRLKKSIESLEVSNSRSDVDMI